MLVPFSPTPTALSFGLYDYDRTIPVGLPLKAGMPLDKEHLPMIPAPGGHALPEQKAQKLANRLVPRPIWTCVPKRRGGGPVSMSSTKITTLDHRLYAWLVQPDNKRFELAFNSYFSLAFPAVVRHLARISRWDVNQLEDLAQDALLKFFERVGRDRRLASQAVDHELRTFRPLNFGPFHTRHVIGWSKDVTSFRDASLGFQLGGPKNPEDFDWREAIRSLSAQIPVLQRQGCHIVYTVRVDLAWDAQKIDSQTSATIAAIQAFAESVAREVKTPTERAQVACQKHPGVEQFLEVHTQS